MKIRVEGTEVELARAKQFYRALEAQDMIKLIQWSKPYRNRNGDGFRIYCELDILADYPLRTKGGSYLV